MEILIIRICKILQLNQWLGYNGNRLFNNKLSKKPLKTAIIIAKFYAIISPVALSGAHAVAEF